MLVSIVREGTSVPPEDAFLAGRILVCGLLFFLVGMTVGLLKWKEIQFVLYIIGLVCLFGSAAIYFGAI